MLQGSINSRLYDQVKVVNQVYRIAKEQGVDAIFFLGDLINPMGEGLAKAVYNAAFYTGTKMAEVAPTYFIVGNHDVYRGVHVLTALEAIENCFVVKATARVDVCGKSIDMVPWDQPLPKGDRSGILLGHIEIHGAQVHLGVPYAGGRLPSELSGYEHIYLGHFHTRQDIGVKDAKQAQYIGAVMATCFSDTAEDRGVFVFDGDAMHFHKIDSPKFIQCTFADKGNFEDFIGRQKDNSIDFYRVTITNPDIKPDPNPRMQFVYDLDPEHRGRMDIQKSESLLTIIKRFIDEANWKGDKGEAKGVITTIGEEAGVF
jgi:DNA repair exonuclease SbcCD nuclease subunit